jgi:glycerol-3-phosphate dehydrogenase
MQRDLSRLASEQFDLLVIGGGAFGAAAAWDAALRGLNVALIDQGDFAAGASAECFKMVHGGIRYLQHADFRRMRASCAERSALLRIAPHLINPLPILIPTYGHGRQGKAFLAAGMLAYDALTAGKNAGISDPQRRISGLKLLSKTRVLELFPDLEHSGLTGGAVFEDGQMYNTARLVLAYVKSAAERGATPANYVEALGFLWEGSRVVGVSASDRLGGGNFEIRAKLVLNAAGPWADYLIDSPAHFGLHHRGEFSRDACFLIDRQPRSPYALAVPGWSKDSDAVVSRAARHLFAVPWRDCTLIGVWHRLFAARPETATVQEDELAAWIAEMNASYPALRLRREDVIYANCGLVPFGTAGSKTGALSFGKESRYHDHRVQGVQGLVTVIGIRYTTARGDAATALDLLLEQMPNAPKRAPTGSTPLHGGRFDGIAQLRAEAARNAGTRVNPATLHAWVRNHGSDYTSLLRLAESAAQSAVLGASDAVLAEVTYAAKSEMAMKLQDVVLRRTDLGSGSHPGTEALQQAARGMQAAAGWSEQRTREEIIDTESVLRSHHAAQPGSRRAASGVAA